MATMDLNLLIKKTSIEAKQIVQQDWNFRYFEYTDQLKFNEMCSRLPRAVKSSKTVKGSVVNEVAVLLFNDKVVGATFNFKF